MRKIVLLVLIIILALILSCDRFEHSFEPSLSNIGLDEFADSVKDLFNSTTQYNYLEISSTFSDNYYNNDNTKDDILNYFGNFFVIDPNTIFTVDSVYVSNSFNIEWHFTAMNSTREIIADTTFFDYLINENNGYVFYGNQNDKRKVVIELFTGQWCSNCPNAEEALHSLKAQYGSRFSYVEYHVGDELAGDFSDLLSYYPFSGTLPVAIVNGNELIIYEAPDPETVQSVIDTAIQPLLQQDVMVTFEDVETSLTNTTLTGNIIVNIDASLTRDDLKLVAVLMEDYNNDYLNHHGDPHYNIVLKRSEIDISGLDLEDPVNFELSGLDALPTWYSELPQDLTLVLWVQRLEPDYDESTCEIYNVIEIPIN